jgi:acyl-CoA synthetase (AMP-forming)/AMP-acid ligase II
MRDATAGHHKFSYARHAQTRGLRGATSGTGSVLFKLGENGGIEDLGLGICWAAPQLAGQVKGRAAVLAAAGLGPGSTIVIAHCGTAHFFADLLAAWERGCCAVCLDTALTPGETTRLIDFVRPGAVLIDAAGLKIPGDVPVETLLLHLATARTGVAAPPSPAPAPEQPALILFTSGTTGDPKGVMLSFGALANRLALNRAYSGPACRGRTLVTLPTSFGHGLIGNALTPLLSGGDIVLHPLGLPLAQSLSRLIDRHAITFMSSVPALWRLALKFSGPPAGATLARVHIGSAPLPSQLWKAVADWTRAEVVNCYGVTELANWVSGASSQHDGIAEALVGRPWGGEAAIIDSNGAINAAGEGELIIKSPSVMSGYLHRPDLTEAAFIDGWYRTGDAARLTDDGLIYLTGRIKDEINRAGLKVQPTEIDALLQSHPAVAEACAFGVGDAVSGEIVAVAVCLAPGANATIEALKAWCAARLRREAIPERWFVVDKLPRNERGKISRAAVRRALVRDVQPGNMHSESTP